MNTNHDISVKSFCDLYAILKDFRGGGSVYRGQKNISYKLIPSIGRVEQYSPNSEKRLFEDFKKRLPAYDGYVPVNDWERLALAQHYELPTRLLDWSENPLVAAFFASRATSSNKLLESDGAIYILSLTEKVDEAIETPFDVSEVKRFRPSFFIKRMYAQRGLFTIHPEPTVPLKLGEDSAAHTRITRIIIDKSFKAQLRWDLHRFGIDESTLFPDLTGMTRFLKWRTEDPEPWMEQFK